MFDWHHVRALMRHPVNSRKRKLYRRAKRNLPLSPLLRSYGEKGRSGEVGRPGDSTFRYANDAISIVTSDHEPFAGADDLGVAESFCISLTTTPARALSSDLFKVLDALVGQRRRARAIYLALPLKYRRSFGIDWDRERPLFVERVLSRYGDRIAIIDCEDQGPATKLLALLEHSLQRGVLSPDDKIVVVDDDIVYADTMIYQHELCHDLYQCDVSIIEERLVQNWIPLRFHRHKAIFCDYDERTTLFGWLGFGFRFDRLSALPQFHADVIAAIPEAFFHDDGVFSAFVKRAGLYATHMIAAPMGPLARTAMDSSEGAALRTDRWSAPETRRGVEKRLDRFLEQTAPTEPTRFVIRSRTAPRNLRNCADLVFHDVGRSMHVVAHYLAEDRAIFTLTVFEPGMVGRDIEIVFSVADHYFRAPLRVESGKFSFVVQAYCALFRPLDDRANLPVMQTNSSAAVSRSKFYSVCAILNYTPAHPHLFFDEKARAALIARHFSAIVVTAYQSLAPAAYRADLFRYLFAYLNACIYFDVKMTLNVPISATYHLVENGHIFAADVTPHYVYTAFFVSFQRRSAIFKSALLMCLDRIAANDYCADAFSITGPGVLGAAVYSDARFTPALFNGFEGEAWRQSSIKDRSGTAVIHCSYPGYYEENNYLLTAHYSVMWDKRSVFRSPPSAFIADYQAIVAGVDHILWISFAGAEERGARMDETLRHFPSIPHHRIDAVAGEFPLPLAAGSDIDAIASAPEIARCLSHLKALSEAAAMEGEHFLILEDGANPRYFPFLGRRDAIAAILERAPHDWQAISIGWVYTSELDRDFTDWNLSLEDGFHIASAAAYLINRAGLEKIQSLFERRDDMLFLKPASRRKVLNAHYDEHDRWLLADLFVFSSVRTYAYKNRLFALDGSESFAALDRHDWHKKTSSILLNTIADEIILSAEEIA